MHPKLLSSVGVRDLERALGLFFKTQTSNGASQLEAATVALRTLWLNIDQGGPTSNTGAVVGDLYNRLKARIGLLPLEGPINQHPGLPMI